MSRGPGCWCSSCPRRFCWRPTARPRAQAPPDVDVSLTAEIDQGSPPYVGDSITLTLTVTHPPDYRVTFPRLPYDWEGFEVRGQSAVENADNLDGTRTTSQSIEAVLFETGDFTTPDVPITVRDTAGKVHDVTVPGTSVTVASVLQGGGEEPKDIRPPAEGLPASLRGACESGVREGLDHRWSSPWRSCWYWRSTC